MGTSMESGKILLVSGLDLVNNTDNLSLDLLSEWITGMAGCTNVQEEEAVIVQVIIAGENYLCLIESVVTHKTYHIHSWIVQETALEVLPNYTTTKAITRPNLTINVKSRKI